MHNKTSVNFINHRWLLLGLLAVLILFLTFPAAAQEKIDMERAKSLYVSKDPNDHPKRDYQRDINRKAETDKRFEDACRGIIDYEKTVYRSNIGDMDIPVYIFQPMRKRGEKGHAALIWVHGGVHGNLSANYFPFIREAVQRGYVVIAPEYRGSTGYGKEHHESIDYGGYEVDDCLTAYDYMVKNMPHVDPDRVEMRRGHRTRYESRIPAFIQGTAVSAEFLDNAPRPGAAVREARRIHKTLAGIPCRQPAGANPLPHCD